MICYKLIHRYKLSDHCETKVIGIYSSSAKAKEAMEDLKTKEGFRDTIQGFGIKRVFRMFKPRLLDKTFWVDGFDTYTY